MEGGGGSFDKDKGMAEIRKQIAALSDLGVKVGIIEGTKTADGASVAEYAAYNEFGTKHIPARPFIRNWIDNNREKIEKMQARLFKQVCEGKISADEAVAKLGQFAQDGIKHYIITGNFTPNAEATIRQKGGKRKKSSRPLIDTGVMRNSIRYQVVGKDGE